MELKSPLQNNLKTKEYLISESIDLNENDFQQKGDNINMRLRRKSSMDYLIPYVGIDIGGTLAKICLGFQKGSQVEFKHIEHLKIETHEQFDIYFEVFPTQEIEKLFQFIEDKEISNITHKFYISGGGAHKFREIIEKRLGVSVIQVPEMQSLSYGLKVLDMLLPNDSVYEYDNEKEDIRYIEQANWMFPLILVQIGSGVSILKVENKDEFQRVSGTSLGGNMFVGLSYLLSGINNFDELLKETAKGNNMNTDLFVSDIYKQISAAPDDIQGDALCVSFGRVKKLIKEGKKLDKADLFKSALQMVAFNVCQIAFLIARIHNINNIFFTGYFIKNHKCTIECIEQAIGYFSKSQQQQKKAYFLKHDGFLGALGSFYTAFEKREKKNRSMKELQEQLKQNEENQKKQQQKEDEQKQQQKEDEQKQQQQSQQ